MSMISAQIDELRELAGDGSMEWVTGPIRASVLRDAADTIWQLRCRLVDAEDRVRKSGELCKLCEREAENAKLRSLCEMLLETYRLGAVTGEGADKFWCREMYDRGMRMLRELGVEADE